MLSVATTYFTLENNMIDKYVLERYMLAKEEAIEMSKKENQKYSVYAFNQDVSRGKFLAAPSEPDLWDHCWYKIWDTDQKEESRFITEYLIDYSIRYASQRR